MRFFFFIGFWTGRSSGMDTACNQIPPDRRRENIIIFKTSTAAAAAASRWRVLRARGRDGRERVAYIKRGIDIARTDDTPPRPFSPEASLPYCFNLSRYLPLLFFCFFGSPTPSIPFPVFPDTSPPWYLQYRRSHARTLERGPSDIVGCIRRRVRCVFDKVNE